jgi:hypothetical protein
MIAQNRWRKVRFCDGDVNLKHPLLVTNCRNSHRLPTSAAGRGGIWVSPFLKVDLSLWTDYSKMCTRQQYLEQSAISPYLSVRAQRSNLHSYLEIASGKMRPRNDRISFTLPLMNTEYSKMLCFH